ncbi:Type 3 secretion system secretin [subsurface metagenome]
MRKVLLYLLVGTFWLGVGLTPCSAEEGTLNSIKVPRVDFQDTDLREALQILSVYTGVSIISDNDVTGKVTARFIDQPLLDVLERILEVNDCEYKLVDNVIMVTRISVMSRIFPLKFALASEIGESLESLLLLSPEGSIQVDEEVNSLVVSDKRPYLEEIARFIQELDSAEKQLRSQSFSPQFLKAEKLASLIKDHLSSKGEIKIYPSTNSLLITETSFHMTKITSLVQSLDTFQPEKKVFPLKFALASDMEKIMKGYLSPEGTLEVDEERNELTVTDASYCLEKVGDILADLDTFQPEKKVFSLKFALASDMEKIIKGYLSPEGTLEVDEERNELAITDASYYLEKVGHFLVDLDSPEKQMRKESFPIKYARIEDLSFLLKENLSPEGTLGVDEERRLISIEDTSYHLFKLERLIQKEDSFIPKKKRYRVRFAPLILVADKAEEMLSDKGELDIQEDTSSFVVSDVEKNLEKIEKLVRKMDNLEDELVTKKYFLTYLTPEEARPLLQVLMTDYGEIRLPRMLGASEGTEKQEEYIIIPQEEPAPRETVSERVFDGQLSETASEKLPSLEEGEAEDNVIYVTDLKRNIPNIDALITYLNGAETAGEIITKTFYIKEGSLERMALAMASILGISPDDIEGLEPKGEWMQMEVPTLEINLGTVGPR